MYPAIQSLDEKLLTEKRKDSVNNPKLVTKLLCLIFQASTQENKNGGYIGKKENCCV